MTTIVELLPHLAFLSSFGLSFRFHNNETGEIEVEITAKDGTTNEYIFEDREELVEAITELANNVRIKMGLPTEEWKVIEKQKNKQ